MADQLNVPIATIRKGAREEVRVVLTEYRGARFADIRVYAEFAGASDAKSPTKAGIAISFDSLPDLAKAVVAAEARARELGLIGGGS